MPRLSSFSLAVVMTALMAVLAPAPSQAAAEAAAWAAADGTSPGHFQDHGLGHDDSLGPNNTHAVGRWTGPHRHGSFAGFNLPAQAWVPTRAQVALSGYVTGPVADEYIRVSLDTGQGTYGPLDLAASRLNEHVGPAGAGTWLLDFSSTLR